jgi:hypothetical protein
MPEEQETNYLLLVQGYIEFFNDQAATVEGFKSLYDEEVVWQEMPNRFAPTGRRLGYEGISADWQRGREYLAQQTYTLRNAVVSGNNAAIEVCCAGTLAQPLAGLSAGTQISVRMAIFFSFHGGKIVGQTDYMCYDPTGE